MRKKLTSIGIISMFLLTGLTTLSALGMKTTSDASIINEYPLPDLKIEFKCSKYNEYRVSCIVFNVGTATIISGQAINIYYIRPSDNGDLNEYHTVVSIPPLAPGESLTFFMGNLSFEFQGLKVTAIVDPLPSQLPSDFVPPGISWEGLDQVYGKIDELDEENNKCSLTLPKCKSKSINQLFNNVLARFLNNLLLQRLLKP